MYTEIHKIIRFLGIKIFDYTEHYTEKDNIELVTLPDRGVIGISIKEEPHYPCTLTQEFIEEKKKRGL